ncbi:MAG: site-specific integrase [Coriobacteriia bacterium]|nr:site-specific integrase [Coriobacteriia bacterium]
MTQTTTRRPKGAGTLRHLGGDRYRFQVKERGVTLSRVFTAKNGTEAEKALPAIRLELVADHARKKDAAYLEREVRQGWTVERYSQHYMAVWAPHHLADTTRARYQSIFTHNVIPHIGRVRMCEVTQSTLTGLYVALGSANARKHGGSGALANKTIATVHAVMRALFAFAVDDQHDFTTNPAIGKHVLPKDLGTPSRPRPAVDVAAVEALVALSGTDAPHIAVPVLLSAYLGTRRGETVGLRWEDVNFVNGAITVRRSISYTKEDGLRVKETKTGKQRTIPLDPHTLAELKRIQREQRRERVRLGEGWRGASSPAGDYIAADPDGAVMRPDTFGLAFRTFCKQHKITGMTPHLLRHAWVSQMIALGFDAVTIAAMSGHSPDVLLRIYAHAFDAGKRTAMEALAEARRAARAVQ